MQDAKTTSLDALKCERSNAEEYNISTLRSKRGGECEALDAERAESAAGVPADRSGARQLMKRRRRRPVALVPPCAASTTDRSRRLPRCVRRADSAQRVRATQASSA
jgi:hypothetical protein